MIDPLNLLMIGAGVLAFREINKKDFGVLTPSRDERYRNVMEYCHQPELLLEEAKLFTEFGLKAQAAMLKRRAEWRARPDELKKAHEEVYQKAVKSKNIPAILEVAQAFEGWTATKKAANLREHVRVLQETMLQEVAQKAAEAASNAESKDKDKKGNGAGTPIPFTGVIDVEPVAIGDDT
jgi:hypothetical protein